MRRLSSVLLSAFISLAPTFVGNSSTSRMEIPLKYKKNRKINSFILYALNVTPLAGDNFKRVQFSTSNGRYLGALSTPVTHVREPPITPATFGSDILLELTNSRG